MIHQRAGRGRGDHPGNVVGAGTPRRRCSIYCITTQGCSRTIVATTPVSLGLSCAPQAADTASARSLTGLTEKDSAILPANRRAPAQLCRPKCLTLGGDPLDDGGKELVFGGQHSFREGVRGVVREDGDLPLGNDRARVVVVGEDVDCGAGDLVSGGQNGFVNGLAVHPFSTVPRQQGGMDVDDPGGVGGADPWTELLHVAGGDNQVGGVVGQGREDRLVELPRMGALGQV